MSISTSSIKPKNKINIQKNSRFRGFFFIQAVARNGDGNVDADGDRDVGSAYSRDSIIWSQSDHGRVADDPV